MQSTVIQNPGLAIEGMRADTRVSDIVSGVVEAAAGLAPGLVVIGGTAGDQVKVPAQSSDVTPENVRGIVLYDPSREPGVFPQYASVSVLRRGVVFCKAASAVAAADSPVYVDDDTGILHGEAAAGRTRLYGAYWKKAGALNAILPIELDLVGTTVDTDTDT